ncbi:hypothetical protein M6B38_254010 [Iris pallida]|uniref:Uncharacterized protein n=1 Tax=Iris pallida TaxID=29817 RepID=A0AAX6II21_IRIPA|nr:hypothetical protein M6B38_254010 [Iris pallida]
MARIIPPWRAARFLRLVLLLLHEIIISGRSIRISTLIVAGSIEVPCSNLDDDEADLKKDGLIW